jgi:hypothetical protein
MSENQYSRELAHRMARGHCLRRSRGLQTHSSVFRITTGTLMAVRVLFGVGSPCAVHLATRFAAHEPHLTATARVLGSCGAETVEGCTYVNPICSAPSHESSALMASVVDELLDQASDPTVSVSNLLRKAKVVAVKLKQTSTAAWIDAELGGEFEDGVPEYRYVPVQLMAAMPFVQGLQPVREPTWLIEITNKPRPMPHPIREIEQMAAGMDQIFISLPPGTVEQLVDLGANTREFWHMSTPPAFEGIVDAVKTRVLNWALGLHELGIHGESGGFSPEERERATGVVVNVNGTMNFAGVMGQHRGGVGASHITQAINHYQAAAHAIAEKLRDGVHANPTAIDLLSGAADEIEAAAEAAEPGRFQRALKTAKSAIPALASWATRVAAEHEIDSLLDLLT